MATSQGGDTDEDFGSETQDKTEFSGDDDLAESEKNDDMDEPLSFFEFLHSNLAPSRRLKPVFFDPDTLVLSDLRLLDFICYNLI